MKTWKRFDKPAKPTKSNLTEHLALRNAEFCLIWSRSSMKGRRMHCSAQPDRVVGATKCQFLPDLVKIIHEKAQKCLVRLIFDKFAQKCKTDNSRSRNAHERTKKNQNQPRENRGKTEDSRGHSRTKKGEPEEHPRRAEDFRGLFRMAGNQLQSNFERPKFKKLRKVDFFFIFWSFSSWKDFVQHVVHDFNPFLPTYPPFILRFLLSWLCIWAWIKKCQGLVIRVEFAPNLTLWCWFRNCLSCGWLRDLSLEWFCDDFGPSIYKMSWIYRLWRNDCLCNSKN